MRGGGEEEIAAIKTELALSQSGKLENRFNKEVMDNYSTRVR